VQARVGSRHVGLQYGGVGRSVLGRRGCNGALSGLIFVGLSVNIRTVLDLDKQAGNNFLTGRAIEALVALLNVLAISLVALTPNISRDALVAFVLFVTLESAISPIRVVIASRERGTVDLATLFRLLSPCALTVSLFWLE
jgi:hypothetical protein